MKRTKGRRRRGVCRECGCTEFTPCIGGSYGTCAWANRGQTLCTACVPRPRTKRERKETN